MPKINKIVKKPVKRKKLKKTISVKIKRTKSIKNPVAYFGCMQACCQNQLKGKKISQVAHECKTNALAVNKKLSAEKLKEVKKLGASFGKFKSDLEEFVKKSIK